MPISSSSVFEIRSTATASNVNGGFFVTGASGTDFSQQDAAQFALTGVTSAGAGNEILSASAAASMVGNGIKVVSGTNFTTGWFEITAVTPGVSITCSTNQAGASISIGVGASGVMNVGGALSLGHTSDDSVFENAVSTNPGIVFWIKNGTYTLGSTVSIGSVGTSILHHRIIGYATTRGDNPVGSTRPTLASGAAIFTLGNFWDLRNVILTGTASPLLQPGSGSRIINNKIVNSSITADRAAVGAGNNMFIFRNELISYRGYGVSSNTLAAMVYCNFIHSSKVGIHNFAAGNPSNYSGNIVASCVTAAIQFTNSATEFNLIERNTLYGSKNTTGIGVSFAAGVTNANLVNNIIYGFTTGVSHGAANTCVDDFNDYFNNDTDVTNWTKGSNDVAIDPAFVGVNQVTGSTATTSGSVLTQAGADFTASGVVAGRDYIYLVSGTGITAGIYGITAVGTTTLTLDIAPGTNATADKVFQITTGQDFSIAGALGVGYPGSFPGGYTIGSADMGAVTTDPEVSSSGSIGGSSLGTMGFS